MNVLIAMPKNAEATEFERSLQYVFPQASIYKTSLCPSEETYISSEKWDIVISILSDQFEWTNNLIQWSRQRNVATLFLYRQARQPLLQLVIKKKVNGVLSIDARMNVMKQAIQTVQSGGMYFDPEVVSHIDFIQTKTLNYS